MEVYVPRQSTVHVSSGDGAVSLDGVTGEITLRSGDGAIEVANSGGQFQVNTGDGTIQISKFDGQVDARTGDGAIALDGNFNALSAKNRRRRDFIDGARRLQFHNRNQRPG